MLTRRFNRKPRLDKPPGSYSVSAVFLSALLMAAFFAAPLLAEDEEIAIGAVLPLTGPASSAGDLIRRGLEMAAADLQQARRPAGRRFRLLFEDTASSPKNAVSAFKKLSDLQGVKIVFTVISSHALALKDLAERKGVLLFADVTHPAVTLDTKYVLRHSNVADADSAVLAEAVLAGTPKNAGIIFQEDEWGFAVSSRIGDRLKAKAVNIHKASHLPDERDFAAQLLQLRLLKLDSLIVVSFGPSAGYIIKKARELGFRGDIYSSVGFILTPDAPVIAGPAATGMFYQSYPPNRQFEEIYLKRFGKTPPLFQQVAYTDLELLALAVETTKSSDPKKLAEYIRGLGSFQGTFETIKIFPSGDIPVKTIMARWP